MGAQDPDDPWDWIQPADIARFGAEITDRDRQVRWSQAVFLAGGLPYMWHKARVPRALIFERLELVPGDRVLLLGEALEGCGFADEVRARIGPGGELRLIEIIDEARDAYLAGARGRGGQLATWKYDYTADVADGHFDCVGVLQGVQHADDWCEAGAELLRIMKPGRRIVLAEIAFGPPFLHRMRQDIHIESLLARIFARIGWRIEDFPYWGPDALTAAFDGLVEEPETFAWKGIEMFWGRKRASAAS